MSDEITVEELAELLRAKLLKEIEAVKPVTKLDFRLMAIRLAERLSEGRVDTQTDLYRAFCEMMGLETRT